MQAGTRETNHLTLRILALSILLANIIWLALSWNSIPETVLIHLPSETKASKFSLLLHPVVGFLLHTLLTYIYTRVISQKRLILLMLTIAIISMVSTLLAVYYFDRQGIREDLANGLSRAFLLSLLIYVIITVSMKLFRK